MLTISSKNKAFSLTEFLVVIAVVAILAIIIFPYYFSARKQLALQRAASQLALNIRKVQGMALSAEEIGGQIPTGGYGIYFRKVPDPQTSYVLFADVNSNKKYDSGDGAGETIEQIFFKQGEEIKIKDLKDANGVSQNHLNIIFKPAKPEIIFTDGDGNELIGVSEVSIEICLIDDCESKFRTIKVNKTGLIFIE